MNHGLSCLLDCGLLFQGRYINYIETSISDVENWGLFLLGQIRSDLGCFSRVRSGSGFFLKTQIRNPAWISIVYTWYNHAILDEARHQTKQNIGTKCCKIISTIAYLLCKHFSILLIHPMFCRNIRFKFTGQGDIVY